MDKKQLKFIFLFGIPLLIGTLITALDTLDIYLTQSLLRGIFSLIILLVSSIGFAFYFDKTNRKRSYLMKALSLSILISSFSSSLDFLIFLVRADFKLEDAHPNNEAPPGCECEFFTIFQYITIFCVGILFVAILIGGIVLGLKIDKRVTKKKKLELHRKKLDNHQLFRIKSIRVISTATPQTINGRKIVRSINPE